MSFSFLCVLPSSVCCIVVTPAARAWPGVTWYIWKRCLFFNSRSQTHVRSLQGREGEHVVRVQHSGQPRAVEARYRRDARGLRVARSEPPSRPAHWCDSAHDTAATLCPPRARGSSHSYTHTHTLKWGAAGARSRTAADGAPRRGGTSACSATAALITAGTLAVCRWSKPRPHFHSHYSQYPKPLTSFCLAGRRFRIFL